MRGEKREEKGREVEKGEEKGEEWERGEKCREKYGREPTEWETEKVERIEKNGEEREGRKK